ncbi:DUF6339 family protein [Oceanobacillus bengalensis]|nr:DUF6339 family protein [Oceanobacillus bengalensis]
MKLSFISDETLMDLRTNYEAYKEHYYLKDNDWFDTYFKEPGRVIESKIEFDMPEFNYDEDYTISDRENVRRIYESLKHLTVSQATQERLWTGLAHLQLRDFAYYRLRNELQDKNDKRINTGVFFKNGKKRSLFVHIIARLWWVGYMTHDETNKENPYWLTDFFCEKDFSARCVVFFSSNLTSNPNVAKGVLRTLAKWQENGIAIKRDHFVQANKYLNVVGGAMILDVLTIEEVEEMVDGYLRRYYGVDEGNMVKLGITP